MLWILYLGQIDFDKTLSFNKYNNDKLLENIYSSRDQVFIYTNTYIKIRPFLP